MRVAISSLNDKAGLVRGPRANRIITQRFLLIKTPIFIHSLSNNLFASLLSEGDCTYI